MSASAQSSSEAARQRPDEPRVTAPARGPIPHPRRCCRPSTVRGAQVAALVALAVASATVQAATAGNPPRGTRKGIPIPAVAVIRTLPLFSLAPTDAEISRVRTFGEPLVPIGATTAGDNRDLADALLGFVRGADPEETRPLVEYLAEHPRSAWRASLLTNLGSLYRRTGHISKALNAWSAAWHSSKAEEGPRGRAVADRAVSEMAALYAGLGHCAQLEALLHEIEGRDVRGSAQERITAARHGLGLMREMPEETFACGPRALEQILRQEARSRGTTEAAIDMRATASVPLGTTLVSLNSLAKALGLEMQMAKRIPGAPVLVPSVVQWEAGPFAALLEEQRGRFRVYDSSLGENLWLSPKALDEEASGYFLVPKGPLPAGWRSVDAQEGERVWYPMPNLLGDVGGVVAP